MERLKKYNEVLGLTGSVNADELKQLYRQRAKELHPDRNKAADSHDRFILLIEAYEFYSALLGKLNETDKASVFNSKKYPEHYYKEKWNVEKRMAAREKAAKQARMKYEEYKRRGYDKKLDFLFYVFDIIMFIQAMAVLIVLPVFMFYVDQFRGLIIALVVQFITYRLWSRPIKKLFRT